MISNENKKNKLFSLKLAKKIVFSLVVVIVFDFIFFPFPTLASGFDNNNAEASNEQVIIVNMASKNNSDAIINTLPENTEKQVKKSAYYTVTAYTSEAAQTDSSPCITANGFNLCEHGVEDSIATNFLPFGTKIRMPEIFGDRVFIVRDRMNARYTNRFDVWMINKADAKKFGVKIAKIEILEP